MIRHVLLSGDCHSNFNHFNRLTFMDYKPEETAIIILGDASLNFHLDERDDRNKEKLNSLGYQIYCIRGNHEFRPEQVFFPEDKIWDGNVKTFVYVEKQYPNIKYFQSGGTWCLLNNIPTFIIDGAYSVDKNYRKMRHMTWNPQEQLSEKEKEEIKYEINKKTPRLILSHTCPVTWQPTDLFLSAVDQSTVDNSMESFLQEIADTTNWQAWCWGHFHETRKYDELEGSPGRTRLMIYQDFIPIEKIVN